MRPEAADADFYLPHPQKDVQELILSRLNNHYQLLTIFFKLGHTGLRAWAPGGPSAWQSNKAFLFYFTQNSCLWDSIQPESWAFGIKHKTLFSTPWPPHLPSLCPVYLHPCWPNLPNQWKYLPNPKEPQEDPLKDDILGFPDVWWLRVHLPTRLPSLAQKDSTGHGVTKRMCHNHRAHGREPALCSKRNHRARALCREPVHRGPRWPQPESPLTAPRPVQPKLTKHRKTLKWQCSIMSLYGVAWPTTMMLSSGFCKLSMIINHLNYSPLSQKTELCLDCFVWDNTVLRAFWDAIPGLQSSSLTQIKSYYFFF